MIEMNLKPGHTRMDRHEDPEEGAQKPSRLKRILGLAVDTLLDALERRRARKDERSRRRPPPHW